MPVRVNIPIRLSMQADRLSGRLREVGDAVEAAVERALASSRRVVLEPRSGCVAADLRRPAFRWTGRAHEIAPPVRTALEACIFEAIDAAANRVGVLTYARGAGSAAEVLPDEVFEPIDRDRFDEALGLYEIPSYDDGKGKKKKKKIVGVSSIQRKEKESRHNWTTVTQITVESKIIGRGRGRALTSDGQTLSIHIEVNNLNVGRFVGQAWRSSTGKEGEPDCDSWTVSI